MGGDWSRSCCSELITHCAISQSPNQYVEARGSACFLTVTRSMKEVSACVGSEGLAHPVSGCIEGIYIEEDLLFPLF